MMVASMLALIPLLASPCKRGKTYKADVVSRPWVNRLLGETTGMISGENDIVLDGQSVVVETCLS